MVTEKVQQLQKVNTQYTFLHSFKKSKKTLDNKRYTEEVLMDL